MSLKSSFSNVMKRQIMYSIIQDNVKSELGKKRKKY
jgi:hypothetical protein